MGIDRFKCDQCDERGIGCNDDGDYLCEDCMFEWMSESSADLEDKFDMLMRMK